MLTQIDSNEALRKHIARTGHLDAVVVQGIDCTDLSQQLKSVSGAGATFLGCQLDDAALRHLTETGALLFPRLDGLPYRPYRPTLYTVDELMHGYVRGRPESFEGTTDGRIYHHFSRYREPGASAPILEAMAQRLHDHAIDDALANLLEGEGQAKRVVAIMGGHSMLRGNRQYRVVAHIARRLTVAGYYLCSGGGPGAMEATNLGAWFGKRPVAQLDAAIDALAEHPEFMKPGYLEAAYDVRDRYPEGCDSLGIPTWFYGHEPTNLFATAVAKYFSNSLREDGLLAIAKHGVIYAPGKAGTVQEVFMDATQNHYGTFHDVSPMLLLGTEYWREQLPVHPLLTALAEGRQYGSMITISDDVDHIVEFIEAHPPVRYDR